MSANSTEITSRPAGGGKSSAHRWLRALELTSPIARQPARTFPVVIAERAAACGDAPALISEGESLTYRALAERADRYARWAVRQGLRKGDVVALMLPNQPDYLAIWLGITRIGAIVSLLNTNLIGRALAHCIDLVAPRHIIIAADYAESFDAIRGQLTCQARVWWHGGRGRGLGDCDIEVALEPPRDGDARSVGDAGTSIDAAPVTTADCALFIYTSGTTGLPKAARISHGRLMMWSHWFAGMIGTQPSDRMYNCLPMYHSVGGVVATGAVLVNGGAVVIRDKFSARRFWDDVVRFDCTLFQYIGELCRYLVNAPAHVRERQHRLRLACGNGLRADVWEEFQHRFRIPGILEFYAATEGNVTMFNVEGKPGAIGRTPPFLAHRSPTALVRFDVARGEPVRDARGFCIRCEANEVGEALGKIVDDGASPGGRFEGYTDRDATARKILRDVFAPGDAWFRTGDLMRTDERGFHYFVDRIGDTFRWKGENVSTTEVAESIASFPGVTEANVYGVEVPGCEGRAGMAAIATEGAIDLVALREHLAARLPDYARPVFLRLQPQIEITATFKHRKGELAREGFNPSVTADAMFVHDGERGAFVPLDAEIFQRIVRGALRL